MKFLVPQGVGDALWALTKIEDINARVGRGTPIEVYANVTNPADPEEARALPFIERFDFVAKVGQKKTTINPLTGPIGSDGHFQYIADGLAMDGIDYTLMPNAPLECGTRLENWLPAYRCDWKVAEHFQFKPEELEVANYVRKEIGGEGYCVFFMASAQGNTIAGHNRNGVWKPQDWVDLGERIAQTLGLRIVVVGAAVDLSYWDHLVKPLLRSDAWRCFIGKFALPQVFALEKLARFVISYQSGVGIFASYLGVPLGIFWRAKGDSISADFHISFEEGMASAWAPPEMIASGKHLPLIYGRHGVDYVFDQIIQRGW